MLSLESLKAALEAEKERTAALQADMATLEAWVSHRRAEVMSKILEESSKTQVVSDLAIEVGIKHMRSELGTRREVLVDRVRELYKSIKGEECEEIDNACNILEDAYQYKYNGKQAGDRCSLLT